MTIPVERANLFGFFDFAVKMTAKQFLEIFLTLARVTGNFLPCIVLQVFYPGALIQAEKINFCRKPSCLALSLQ